MDEWKIAPPKRKHGRAMVGTYMYGRVRRDSRLNNGTSQTSSPGLLVLESTNN